MRECATSRTHHSSGKGLEAECRAEVLGSGFGAEGLGFRIFECKVCGFGFRVYGLAFAV